MNSVSTELEHKDLKSVRKAMYIERRKNLPPYPTSFEDAITKINEFQDANCLMFSGLITFNTFGNVAPNFIHNRTPLSN